MNTYSKLKTWDDYAKSVKQVNTKVQYNMNTQEHNETANAQPENVRNNDGIVYGVAIDGQTGRFVRYADERCNPINGRQFNNDYPRFINTACLTPDGLFWQAYDRLNNAPISRMNDHATVYAWTNLLNNRSTTNESPKFNTWE